MFILNQFTFQPKTEMGDVPCRCQNKLCFAECWQLHEHTQLSHTAVVHIVLAEIDEHVSKMKRNLWEAAVRELCDLFFFGLLLTL